ncbi:MAG: putative peptidoglycan glycosyltransferase FtsW [Kiritimatiellia bacterium]|nr:putative peptidoglycan glycosyltransferase FtsW [Kiritimatiellia bacterium]
MRQARVVLGLAVLALVAIGFVVLSSAGSPVGYRKYHDFYYFLKQQGRWLAIAMPLFLAAVFFDYRKWREQRWLTVLMYVSVVIALAAVFGFRPINGSRRWLMLGPIHIQPSEFAKIAVVITMSVFLDRAGWRIELFWKGALRALAIIAVPMLLAVFEPDFGSTMVIALSGGVLMFIAGMRWRHMILLGVAGTVLVGSLLLSNGNRMRRISAWMPETAKVHLSAWCPWLGDLTVSTEDAREANHQLDQALIAIRNGGETGLGYCNSRQKERYLPENHTDFIFAIGAEEWGVVFSLLMLSLFVTVFVCGMIIAAKSCDRLGRLMAFGMTFLIFFQAMFNMGVVTGLLPTKGLALPFISYGGTNLMTALIAVGVLINISRQADLQRIREKSKIQAVFHIKGG